jgi:hypothetical protein
MRLCAYRRPIAPRPVGAYRRPVAPRPVGAYRRPVAPRSVGLCPSSLSLVYLIGLVLLVGLEI